MKPKYQHSPDTYDDTSLGPVPPRREYHAEQEGLHAKTSKKAGGTPSGVQQNSGTENLRAEGSTKMAAAKSTPSGGKKRYPSGVQTFNDSEV